MKNLRAFYLAMPILVMGCLVTQCTGQMNFGELKSETEIDCDDFQSDNKSQIFLIELANDSSAQASSRLECRRRQVLSFFQQRFKKAIPENSQSDNRKSFRQFAARASAALLLEDVAAVKLVNEVLENSQAQPWNYGSEFDIGLGPACRRLADYDFVAYQLAQLPLINKRVKNPDAKLSEGAINKIKQLLPLYGAPAAHIPDLPADLGPVREDVSTPAPVDGHGTTFTLNCGLSKKVPDTENHVLMTNISKYLTNEVVGISNEEVGYDRWMVNHLDRFLNNYFDEYNSRPYQEYAIAPILTLANLTQSPEVRVAAMNVIEQVVATIAVQTNGLRRFAPFRRQPQYSTEKESYPGDGILSMVAYLSGHYSEATIAFLKNRGATGLLSAALWDKQPLSDVTLSLLTDEPQLSYEQVFKYSGNQERYSATPAFLLSAAGRFHSYEKCPESVAFGTAGCLTDQQHGWGRATVLIPTASPATNLDQLIHFRGHKDLKKRNNQCVSEGIACGLNLAVPIEIMEQCQVVAKDRWTFIDLNNSELPVCNLGIYVATLKEACADKACGKVDPNYGVLYVMEVGVTDLSFEAYQAKLQENNPSAGLEPLPLNQDQAFYDVTGQAISYHISTSYDQGSYIVEDINIANPESAYQAAGTLINNEQEKVQIFSPTLGQSISLCTSKSWNKQCYGGE